MKIKSRGIILLCAGSGSRMGSLTKDIPKCLLPVNGQELVIDYLLKEILLYTDGEVVVVTGFNSKKVIDHLENKYGNRIKSVFNKNYEKDTNIYSVELGVSLLNYPENGYIIVETDILCEPSLWKVIFEETKENYSFWVCRLYYNSQLTGGIVHSNNNNWIDYIKYQPKYDNIYLGWSKMLGIMSVGPQEVKNDKKYRQLALKRTMMQYYLDPWSNNLTKLPCKILQIDSYFAKSFNTESEFLEISKEFSVYQNNGENNEKYNKY